MFARSFSMNICLAVMLTASVATTAGSIGEPIRIKSGDRHYEHLAGAADTAGRLWLLVAESTGDPYTGDKTLRLWKLDRSGKRIVDRRIDVEGVIAGRCALFAGASDRQILIGIPTLAGAQIVDVRADPDFVLQQFSDADQRGGVWFTFSQRVDGVPLAVTSLGISTVDDKTGGWDTVWRPGNTEKIIDAVVNADGALELLTMTFGEQLVNFRAVRLSASGTMAVHSTDLAPVGPVGVHGQLVTTATGLLALIPLDWENPSHWRIDDIDVDGNLLASRNFELSDVNGALSTYMRLNGALALVGATRAGVGSLIVLDDRLQVASRAPWPPGDEHYRRIRRSSVVKAEGGDYLVLSTIVRHPTNNQLRGELSVSRLTDPDT